MDDLIFGRRPPRQVVKAQSTNLEFDFDEGLFDRVLGTPNKIEIPERYIPEPERLPPEEQLKRNQKAEAICRLLSKSSVGPLPFVILPPRASSQASASALNTKVPPPSAISRPGTSSASHYRSSSGYNNTTYSNQYQDYNNDEDLEEELNNLSLRGHDDKSDEDESDYLLNGHLDYRQQRRLNSFSGGQGNFVRGRSFLSNNSGSGGSVPSTPVRRVVSIRRPSPGSNNQYSHHQQYNPSGHQQGRSSSSFCDWSLAGVSCVNPSPYKVASARISSAYSQKPVKQPIQNSYYTSNNSSLLASNYPSGGVSGGGGQYSSAPNPPSFSSQHLLHHSRSYSSSSSSKSSDREDFLHLQQDIAREVTQKSRLVAARALALSPATSGGYNRNSSTSSSAYRYREPSPPSPVELPTIQQREGFFT